MIQDRMIEEIQELKLAGYTVREAERPAPRVEAHCARTLQML